MIHDITTTIINKYRVIITFNTAQDILYSFGLFIIAFVVLHVFKFVIVKRVKVLAEKTKTHWDDDFVDMVYDVGPLFYLLLPIILALNHLEYTPQGQEVLEIVTFIVTVYYAINIGQILIVQIIKKFVSFELEEIDDTFTDLLEVVVRVTLWVLAAIFIIKNLGYNITALLGSLGIAGVAVAFALKNILADVIAFFTLHLDKPFVLGDFIVAGKDQGTVKSIGVKSVRLQTLQGQELVIPNQDVTNSRVKNYTRMGKRRVNFTFGIVHDVPMKKVRKIPSMVVEIANDIDEITLGRVHLKELAPSSLDFEVVYFVDSNNYEEYMDNQQKLNFALLEKLRENNIELAYPTRTLFIQGK